MLSRLIRARRSLRPTVQSLLLAFAVAAYFALKLAPDWFAEMRYRDLIANPRPDVARRPPSATRGRPATLDRPPANRPWRAS